MIKQLAPIVVIVAALFASAAMPAVAQEPTIQQAGETYNWLHPKLGIVKVDRATGAIVHSEGAAKQSAQAGARILQIKNVPVPKGNVGAIKTPATDTPQGASSEAHN